MRKQLNEQTHRPTRNPKTLRILIVR